MRILSWWWEKLRWTVGWLSRATIYMLSNKIALKITIKWNAAANTPHFNVDRIERTKLCQPKATADAWTRQIFRLSFVLRLLRSPHSKLFSNFRLAPTQHPSAFVFIKEFPQVFQVFSCLPVAPLPCVPALACASLQAFCFLHSCLTFVALLLS